MKTYYVYVRGTGIVSRQFFHKETATDVFFTLLNDYGVDNLIFYDTDFLKVQKSFLDNIYYETYKV